MNALRAVQRADEEERALVGWPGEEEIVLVLTDGVDYNKAVREVTATVDPVFDAALFVCANRPHGAVRDNAPRGVDMERFQYLDCVSALTGVLPPAQPGVHFVESPTMLEKIGLRAEQMLRRSGEGKRILILDSLSTLSVYSDVQAVAEMVHNLVTRLRRLHAGAALILVERQAPDGLQDAIVPLCDRTVRY